MLLEAKEVSFRRRERLILDDISFSVEPGEAVALVGPNGSGKTTFIKLVTHFLHLQEGSITVLGSPTIGPQRRQRLGVVWQDRGLPLSVSSRRWVKHLSALYGTAVDAVLLERLEVPLGRTPIRYMSGGEQQRLALYGALAHSPKLLILDEATVGLDDQSRGTVYAILRERLATGAGILFTSHYAQDVAVLSHRYVDLNPQHSPEPGAALFTVDGVIDLFAVARLVPEGYQLVNTTNGYRIKGADQAQLLAVATNIAKDQGLSILSFTVVGSV